MTPEERAGNITLANCDGLCFRLSGPCFRHTLIADAIRAAIAEEREACARICDEAAKGEGWAAGDWFAASQAAAIRARGHQGISSS